MSQSTAGLRQERRELKYNFDEVIDRSKNRSAKYDEREKKFGRKDVIPLWIADMDFKTAQYPNRMMVGAETMAADLPYNWERVKKYPQLIGDFVWSAWDYLGEACMGWTYESYKGLPLLANQGMIDMTGKPLAAMAYLQVVWGLRKEPFIGVHPLNHAKESPTKGSWQFTDAIDSWNWPGYADTKATIEVYAPGNAVRLLLNG